MFPPSGQGIEFDMSRTGLSRRLNVSLLLCVAVLSLVAGRAGAQEGAVPHHDEATTSSTAAPGEAAEVPREHESSTEGHEGGVDYNKPPLNFEPPLFVFSLVLFLALVFGGRWLAWDPLIAGLDSREARVNQAYAAAESARQQAEQLIVQHDAHLAAAQEQVKAIVAEARQEAEGLKEEITTAAAADAQSLQEGAIADIVQAKEQALSELSAAAEQYTTLATEHVLGYSLSGR